MEYSLTNDLLAETKDRLEKLGGYLALDKKKERIQELQELSEVDGFWDDNQAAQKVLKESKELKDIVEPYENTVQELEDLTELFEMALEEQDQESLRDLDTQFEELEKALDKLEFMRKLSGPDDTCNAVLTINSGAGGTESCDWADMLYRMYSRWCERHNFKASVIEMTPGEGAGIKSISLEIEGEYVYGHLKAESGVHRLVRISPFDSQARRHTSFASVFAYPIFDEVDDFELEEKDIRVDTYRASGAGGQHVNKTDSAVRMTHIPTNIVVQCQNQRSQIKNRATALKMLKARVRLHYKEEEEKARLANQDDKKKIEWGSQIRSYVLNPYNMVKDHRTNYETSNTQAVLDGDIDNFIEAYLLAFA